MPRDFLLLKYL